MAAWSTPADIRARVRRWWDRGEILAAIVTGAALFPREVRLTGPKAKDINDDFGRVMDWVRTLRDDSRERIEHGYDLRWETRRSRLHGENDIPVAAVIPDQANALRLLRRGREAERFHRLVEETGQRLPALHGWLSRRPLQALEHADDWSRLLDVVEWFRRHPRPGLYLRQLEIPGVDSKFIEARRGLITELLDEVLPGNAIDTRASGARAFSRRYGLLQEPALIRFRILDPAHALQGLTDLSVPPEEFARLDLPVERIYITENRINGLAFPRCAGSIVIFGLGYGLDRLSDIDWLHEREIHYWGDIDTHGFGILNRLRAAFPNAHSLLMDRDTLTAHRELWGSEPGDKRYTGEPTHLTDDEYSLFRDLRENRLGDRVRLEQERVNYGWLRARIQNPID